MRNSTVMMMSALAVLAFASTTEASASAAAVLHFDSVPLLSQRDEPSERDRISGLSREAESKIRKIVEAYHEARKDCKLESTKRLIYADVEKQLKLPSQPRGSVDNRQPPQLETLVARELKKSFPQTPDDYRRQVLKTAEIKFKPYQIGDTVEITYSRGPNQFVAKGRYAGALGRHGNVIKVNNVQIAVDRVSEADQQRLDPVKAKKAQDEYVNEQVRKYTDRYKNKQNRIAREAMDNIYLSNERNGYLFLDGKWYSVMQVVDDIVMALPELPPEEKAAEVAKHSAADAAAEAAAVEAKKAEAARAAADAKARLAMSKQNAENFRKNWFNTHIDGADVHPGFGEFVWDTPKSDVVFLLKQDKKEVKEAEGKVIFSDKHDSLCPEFESTTTFEFYKDYLVGYTKKYENVTAVANLPDLMDVFVTNFGSHANGASLPDPLTSDMTMNWKAKEIEVSWHIKTDKDRILVEECVLTVKWTAGAKLIDDRLDAIERQRKIEEAAKAKK